jgi:peptidoglycan/LPS O-acetylase OafA/YrhL
VTTAEPALGRHPALDGLRAIAVLAVLGFHGNISWLGGGFLGVDLFFVLSGFLITRLLLDERGLTGTIALGRFYARRVLRLFPALVVVGAAVIIYAEVHLDPAQASRALHDALATATYHMNWRLALFDHPPFGRFDHAWSLAIEEQFYVLWPLLVAVLARRRGPRAVAIAAGTGVALSAAFRVALSLADQPARRIYYGLDTHADGLLLGALFAALTVIMTTSALRRRLPRWAGAAALCFAGLAMLRFVRGSTFVDTTGLLLFELAVAIVLLDVVSGSPITRFLEGRALVGIGRISYGIYLWHWPVFLAITAGEVHEGETALFAVRVLVTFALALASYQLVERPFLRLQQRFRLPAPRGADRGAAPDPARPTT